MSYNENFAETFKSKVQKILPVLTNKKIFGYQFVSCFELFSYYCEDFSEPLFDAYTIAEAVILRDFSSFSVFNFFSKGDTVKKWKTELY